MHKPHVIDVAGIEVLHERLEELIIDNRIKDSFLTHLVTKFNNTKLISINCRYERERRDIYPIAEAMKSNTLWELCLYETNALNIGAQLFANALVTNTTLVCLTSYNTHLSHYLAESLDHAIMEDGSNVIYAHYAGISALTKERVIQRREHVRELASKWIESKYDRHNMPLAMCAEFFKYRSALEYVFSNKFECNKPNIVPFFRIELFALGSSRIEHYMQSRVLYMKFSNDISTLFANNAASAEYLSNSYNGIMNSYKYIASGLDAMITRDTLCNSHC